jgi:hypothetical protein
MTVGQAIDTKLRTSQTLVAALSTTSALTTSSVIAQGTNTITRESGSFIADGWVTGYKGYITDSGANNLALFTVTGTVAALTLTVTETLTAQTKTQCGACVLTRYYDTRLYQTNVLQTTTVPYLVFGNVFDDDEVLYFDCADTGTARYQFDLVADKAKPSHRTYMDTLRTLLRNTSGSIGGLNVQAILPLGIYERFNSDTQRYVWTTEYEISYSRD